MQSSGFLATIYLVYPFLGVIGSLIILAGSIFASSIYRGKAGEPYSVRNHFISELGEIGVSKAAAAFNYPMKISGFLFLPFMIGLGFQLNSVWGFIAMGLGIIAVVSSSFVGVFSMDRLTPHRIAAMTYFRSGLLTILFFTIAIFAQKPGSQVVPLFINVFGLLAILAYSSFLVIVGKKMDKNENPNYILDPQAMPERPYFWRSAFLEWMVFFTTILWFLGVSVLSI